MATAADSRQWVARQYESSLAWLQSLPEEGLSPIGRAVLAEHDALTGNRGDLTT